MRPPLLLLGVVLPAIHGTVFAANNPGRPARLQRRTPPSSPRQQRQQPTPEQTPALQVGKTTEGASEAPLLQKEPPRSSQQGPSSFLEQRTPPPVQPSLAGPVQGHVQSPPLSGRWGSNPPDRSPASDQFHQMRQRALRQLMDPEQERARRPSVQEQRAAPPNQLLLSGQLRHEVEERIQQRLRQQQQRAGPPPAFADQAQSVEQQRALRDWSVIMNGKSHVISNLAKEPRPR